MENVTPPFVAGSMHKTEPSIPEIKGDAALLDNNLTSRLNKCIRHCDPGALMALICSSMFLVFILLLDNNNQAFLLGLYRKRIMRNSKRNRTFLLKYTKAILLV